MKMERYTFCHLCMQLCGIAVTVNASGKIEKIRPDKQNPYSWRDFCIKGATSHEILSHPRRIRTPLKRKGDRYIAATYEDAVGEISQKLQNIIDRYGPNAVGSYFGNPAGFLFGSTLFQNLFMLGIGSNSQFWPGSVDQNAVNVVAEQMYGTEWGVFQVDVENCRFPILIGANPFVSGMGWLEQSPGGWKKLLRKRKGSVRLVVVDPRRSESAEKAVQHIAPLPDTDWALLLGMIKVILDSGFEHQAHCVRVNGFDLLKRIVERCDLLGLSRCCDVPVETIEELATAFSRSETGAVIARTGAGMGINGTINIWLAQVLNIISGRLDSVGGLYYMPGVLDLMKDGGKIFPPSKILSRVRQLMPVSGYHHLAELPDEISTPGPGQIRAMIINSGNPVVAGPDSEALDSALQQLDYLVCVDLLQRESHRHADWLIPGVHFLEREEFNPLLHSLHDRFFAQISRQVVPKPATIRYEWEFFRDLGLAMNLPMGGKRWLNPMIRLSNLMGRLKKDPYFSFSPRFVAWSLVRKMGNISWKRIINAPHGVTLERPKFGNLWNNVQTKNGKIDLCPAPFVSALETMLRQPLERCDKDEYPLQLISRRRRQMMNSWLVETTGQRIRKGVGHEIEVNPKDCKLFGVKDGDAVHVVSATDRITARVRMSAKIRPGVVVMEHGWGSRLYAPQNGDAPIVEGVNRNRLVSNRELDPFSGLPRLNGTPIRLERLL